MNKDIVEIGIAHGRFQPFHLDHLKYILAAKERCKKLIIGITNPDPLLTKDDKVNLERSQLINNPLSYYERMIIIKETLIDIGLKNEEFDIVPFPINRPELIYNYVPIENSIFFITIYDEWGKKKKNILENLNLKVEVLWELPLSDKGISAINIRYNIINNLPWEHLLNQKAVALIKKNKYDKKIIEKSLKC